MLVCWVALAAGAAPAAAEPPRLTATYDRGVVLASDDGTFRLRLALRSQVRLESTRAAAGSASTASRLYVPRARLQLEGHVFGAATRYKLELGLGDRGGFGFVRDLFVEQRLPRGGLWVRAGQWKRPFNRQELIADFASELNERAITADFAGGGRDVGVAIHNDYEASPDGLEWVVGLFNSFSGGGDRPAITTTCSDEGGAIDCTTPPPTAVPADFAPALVARAGWNLGGIRGYSEADLEGGPLRLAVGLAYKIDLADLSRGEQATVAANLQHGLQADALLKVAGLDVQAGVYLMRLRAAAAQLGAFTQAGWFVTPRRAQVAARVAFVPAAGPRTLLEARAGFTWHWQGHAWKWATDVGALHRPGSDPVTMTADDPELQLRSMAQLTF
jgi:hypothetical protein